MTSGRLPHEYTLHTSGGACGGRTGALHTCSRTYAIDACPESIFAIGETMHAVLVEQVHVHGSSHPVHVSEVKGMGRCSSLPEVLVFMEPANHTLHRKVPALALELHRSPRGSLNEPLTDHEQLHGISVRLHVYHQATCV